MALFFAKNSQILLNEYTEKLLLRVNTLRSLNLSQQFLIGYLRYKLSAVPLTCSFHRDIRMQQAISLLFEKLFNRPLLMD